MKLITSFLFLILGVTLIQAGPTPKIVEKESLAEDTKAKITKENLKIEETGEEKDRSKKAAFCLQVEPGPPQVAQIALNENQLAVQNLPLTMQAQSVPQQYQTLSLMQPVPQPLSQANIVLPQQVVQPIHTLQIVQPAAQPCAQSGPSVNIIQSPPQANAAQTAPKPKPTPTPAAEVVPVTEQPKPMRIEKPPQPLHTPQETLTVLPVIPAYQEQLMLTSEPEQYAFIQIPSFSACHNPFHRLMSECTCQKVEPMTMSMVPIVSYPQAYARSSVVMPHTVPNHAKMGPQGRTSTFVNVNVPPYGHHFPHHLQKQTMYQKTYMKGLDPVINPYGATEMVDNTYATKGFAMNSYPPTFRTVNSPMHIENSLRSKQNNLGSSVMSEAHDLMQTSKATREIDSIQLSPEKVEENKEEGKAMLIDGRRNARSNKAEIKEQKKQ